MFIFKSLEQNGLMDQIHSHQYLIQVCDQNWTDIQYQSWAGAVCW